MSGHRRPLGETRAHQPHKYSTDQNEARRTTQGPPREEHEMPEPHMSPTIWTSALTAHEMLTSYIGAGFTRAEALELVKVSIAAAQAAQ